MHSRTVAIPKLDHSIGPTLRDVKQINLPEFDILGDRVDSPMAELAELIAMIQKNLNTGKKFSKELLSEMIDGFWMYDRKSKTVVPIQQVRSLKLPVVPTGQIPASFFEMVKEDEIRFTQKSLVEPLLSPTQDVPEALKVDLKVSVTDELWTSHKQKLISELASAFFSTNEILLDKRLEAFFSLSFNKVFNSEAEKVKYDKIDIISKQVIRKEVQDSLKKNIFYSKSMRIEIASFINSVIKLTYSMCYRVLDDSYVLNIKRILQEIFNDLTESITPLQDEVKTDTPVYSTNAINLYGQVVKHEDGQDSGKVGDFVDDELKVDMSKIVKNLYAEIDKHVEVISERDFTVPRELESVEPEMSKFDSNFNIPVDLESVKNSSKAERLDVWNKTVKVINDHVNDSQHLEGPLNMSDPVIVNLPIRVARLKKIMKEMVSIYVKPVDSLSVKRLNDGMLALVAYQAESHILRLMVHRLSNRRFSLISLFVMMETGVVITFLSHSLVTGMNTKEIFEPSNIVKNKRSYNRINLLFNHLSGMMFASVDCKVLVQIDSTDTSIKLPFHTFIQFYHQLRLVVSAFKGNRSAADIKSIFISDERGIPYFLDWLKIVDEDYFVLDKKLVEGPNTPVVFNNHVYLSTYRNPSGLMKTRVK